MGFAVLSVHLSACLLAHLSGCQQDNAPKTEQNRTKFGMVKKPAKKKRFKKFKKGWV